jgi:elongation factor G
LSTRKDAQIIKAKVPLSEMFGYSTQLRSMSQGRAIYTMQFAYYDEVPQSIADEIVEKVKGKEAVTA